MKTILLDKTYPIRLVVLLGIITTSINIQAQIIYTDINPDFISDNIGDFYNLDVNNDGIKDFNLKSSGDTSYSWSIISSLNDANLCIVIPPWYTFAVPLESGIEIYNLSGYGNVGYYYGPKGLISITGCFDGGLGCEFDWQDKNNKYLGLRFLINGQIHYGWARLDVTSTSQWVIKDYAYQATPNTAIITGQMVLDIEKSDFNSVKVIVTNRYVSIILNHTNNLSYNIYDINGRELHHGKLKEINNIIDVSHFESGLYIIELISNYSPSTTRKKIIIH